LRGEEEDQGEDVDFAGDVGELGGEGEGVVEVESIFCFLCFIYFFVQMDLL
jgi:hypothetical protein